MKKRALLGILLCLLGLSLAACSAGGGGAAGGKQDPAGAAFSPLKLGLIPVEDNFPFYVAMEEGLFREAGLPVELVPFNSARDRDTAFQAGQVDGETADLIAAGLFKKGGTPMRVVSLTMGSTPAEGRFALLGAPGKGIASPALLKGGSVALSQNTIIEYVADRLLLGAGLNPGEVKKTFVPAIPERLTLLLNGTVEAALLPDPFATLAEQKGATVVLDDTRGKENLSQVVLLFREDAIGSKAPSIKKLLEVYARAAEKITADPRKYQTLFVDRARVPAELKDSYLAPRYSPPSLPSPQEVAAVMDWMVKKGLLEKPYTYAELVANTFVSGR